MFLMIVYVAIGVIFTISPLKTKWVFLILGMIIPDPVWIIDELFMVANICSSIFYKARKVAKH